ncbi:MAG: hypothetical protein RJB67_897, partial [Bacteroidota bacterium]
SFVKHSGCKDNLFKEQANILSQSLLDSLHEMITPWKEKISSKKWA